MYKIGEAEMVICPYNRYHIVSKLRIQRHIVKCKKNYPDVKLATCFYNYCHRVKPEAVLQHYEICSHKTRMEGARYDVNFCSTSISSKRCDYQSKAFPDINAKPKFFCDFSIPSSSNQECCKDNSKLDSFDSEGSEYSEDCQSVIPAENAFQPQFSDEDNKNVDINDDDDDDDDDDLEPLPLPKTKSKAFVYMKQNSNSLAPGSSTISPHKIFGRGKNLFATSAKPRTTDHLLPDLSSMESLPKKEGRLKFFLKSASSDCSRSIKSSIFDDNSTLKSEDILDNDIYDEDNSDFIFKNFDKYIKI